MAFILDDRVRESSTTTGTGAFALGGAPNTSYQAFSAVMSIGDTCWYAIVLPGAAWETGIGTYSGVNTLTRTTVLEISNAGALVTFAAGTKDVLICLPASKGNVQNNTFPPGTVLCFQQTAAPTYWTKQTTHNDKALRVVSGTASSGGTNAFSTVMAQTTVGNHTITQSELASHGHSVGGGVWLNSAGGSVDNALGGAPGYTTPTIANAGSDVAHNHTIALSIAYVDLILASKD